jgi:Ca2+/Na+ antiporter
VGLLASLAVLVPYLVVSGVSAQRLRWFRLPQAWVRWLAESVGEERQELEGALASPRAGGRDVLVAVLATIVVVGASVAMELTASTFGERHHVAEIVTGAVILAGVTSLPNAVSALYLARRGRGAATLSIALNSNALNVIVGLLVPGVIVGLGAPSSEGTLVAAWYLALTVVTLGCAYAGHGLDRAHGVLIICGYVAFVAAVLIVS